MVRGRTAEYLQAADRASVEKLRRARYPKTTWPRPILANSLGFLRLGAAPPACEYLGRPSDSHRTPPTSVGRESEAKVVRESLRVWVASFLVPPCSQPPL